MLLLSSLLALISLAGEPELQHGGDVFWAQSGWTIYRYADEKTCDLTREFDNGENLTVEYDAQGERVILIVTNKHATSLVNDQKVYLDILFVNNNNKNYRMRNIKFTAKSNGFGPVLVSDMLTTNALNLLSNNSVFMVMYNEKVVGGSVLNGSGVAISQLKICSKSTAGIDPKDPFK
ncbi:MAG: hypothetical protein H7241_06675 [Novosphingobium sp.]|nr:hypothetical protein [Novosphingobium sp.]